MQTMIRHVDLARMYMQCFLSRDFIQHFRTPVEGEAKIIDEQSGRK